MRSLLITSSFARLAAVLVLAVLFPGAVPATEEVRPGDKGTFLGVLVRPNTDGRTEPAPVANPAPARGVCITHVLPDSPAARANLRRNDVLLQYDDQVIRDGEHLTQLIRNDKPERKVKLRLVRDGKEQTAEVTLTLGPPLTIAPGLRKGSGSPEEPVGVAKPGPASVGVVVTPLEEGKVRLTIESSATGKVQTVTCTGAAEIASVVQNLPERERNLVRIAIQRLRSINNAPPQGPIRK